MRKKYIIGIIGGLILCIGLIGPRLKTVRMSANDGFARIMLEDLAHAYEYYAKDHPKGYYPKSRYDLSAIVSSSYIPGYYCDITASGFSYVCESSIQGYTFVATPVVQGKTGSMVMTIKTGGILSPYHPPKL